MLRALVFTLLLVAPFGVRASLDNRLADHPSPYLAMHGQDPVHWQDWGADVLALAQEQGRLIFVSSGYYACHWCHVMQRESYRNPDIARLLNQGFIAVKVDRELHPALDAYLIDFVQRTRGSAGWPLNVILTPEGFPVFGLTYAPPAQFRSVLERAGELWVQRRDTLITLARQAAQEAQSQSAKPKVGEKPDRRLLRQRLLSEALKLADEMEGGFGPQSRFPMAPQLLVLLDQLEREPNPPLLQWMELTLDQMAKQGMRDQLGGGFFRYTEDPGWQDPHFEKMLYTNALLVQVYLRAARLLQRSDYLEVARDTLDFALRDLAGEDGGFIASLSAVDDQGVEGGFYLWTEAELSDLLTPEELAVARLRWRLFGAPDHEAGYLPLRWRSEAQVAEEAGVALDEVHALLETATQKLLRRREQRSLPRDDKQLAGWNGLLLSALSEAVQQLSEPRYRAAGQALRSFLLEQLWDGKRIARAGSASHPIGTVGLQDYAYVACGLAAWSAVSGDAADSKLAARLVGDAWRRFFFEDGWQQSDTLRLPGQPREPALSDGPLPAPSAVIIELSRRLEPLQKDPAIASQVERALALSAPPTDRAPFWHASHAQVLLFD